MTIATVIVGGLRAVGPLAAADPAAGGRPPRLRALETFRLGDDVVLSGTPLWIDL